MVDENCVQSADDDLRSKPLRDDLIAAVSSLRDSYDSHKAEDAEHDRQTLSWMRRSVIGNFVYTFFALVATGAAVTAAVYSSKQATYAWQANHVVQRPFITVSGLQINRQNSGNPGLPYLWFTVEAKNSGATPTRGLRYLIWTGTLEDPDILFRTQPRRVFSATIPPHYDGSLGYPTGIPLSSFKSMVAAHAWYTIVGEVRYFDPFPDSAEHLTKFCFAVGASISDDNQPAYEPCVGWNCSDEDCEIN